MSSNALNTPQSSTAILKQHTESANYCQSVPDPLAHFNAIPWCAALLSEPGVVQVAVPDRHSLPNGESSFVHKTMNSSTTVRACVTFIRVIKPPRSASSSSKAKAASAPPSNTSASSDNKNQSQSRNQTQNKGAQDPQPQAKKPISKSAALLGGGGRDNGEDPRNPFLLLHALADLGVDMQSFPGIMHGGLYGVLLDEVMGTAANAQTPYGAYTVRFTTNFRRAVRTPQVVLIRGRVVKKEGRKIHVRGTIEDKDGNIMAEGDGLWLAVERNMERSKL